MCIYYISPSPFLSSFLSHRTKEEAFSLKDNAYDHDSILVRIAASGVIRISLRVVLLEFYTPPPVSQHIRALLFHRHSLCFVFLFFSIFFFTFSCFLFFFFFIFFFFFLLLLFFFVCFSRVKQRKAIFLSWRRFTQSQAV